MPEPIKRIKQEIKKRGYGVLGIIVLAGGMIFTEEMLCPVIFPYSLIKPSSSF
jgi:hypothetical protein